MTHTNDTQSTYRKLVRLKNLENYKVADDNVDIRNFAVKTSDEKTIGKVKNLIVDTDEETVRYIEIQLEDNIIKVLPSSSNYRSYTEKDGDKIIIVPIGMINIHQDHVHVEGVTAEEFGIYPRYNSSEEITADYENSVFDYWQGPLKNPVGIQFDRAKVNERSTIIFNNRFYGSPYFKGRKYRSSGLQTDMTKPF